jgi:ATP-binding cassette, subfamily B, multidrug efflux pump
VGLRDISFTIPEGSTLAITGRTGSGKSTIAGLLLRAYDPDTGQIRIGSHPLGAIRLDDLREHLAYVPQDVFLFSDTIRHNIAFGSDPEGEEEIISAARAADIHDTVLSFPTAMRLNSANAVSISAADKNSAFIARAIMRKAPF